MKKIINNRISNEIFRQICVLENEKNQDKQKIIAQGIIEELSIEDFNPYIAYDDEGDLFIAMNYYYSFAGIEEAILSGKHDVIISSEGVYIEDENYFNCLKEEINLKNKIEMKELREEQKKEFKNQKKYDEVSERLDFIGNRLQNLVNFERHKYGSLKEIIEIDEEIANTERVIENLEKELEELEK